jgi:thiol-disulfide isomerase/thioredoxin
LFRLLIVALSLLCLPNTLIFAQQQPQDPSAQTDAVFEDLKGAYEDLIKYLKNEPNPDAVQVEKLQDEIRLEAYKLINDTTQTDSVKQNAYMVYLGGLLAGTQVDFATYFAKFRTLADEVRTKFPGSQLASIADVLLLQVDSQSMDSATFIQKLTDYSKTYPSSAEGAMLAAIYADKLSKTDIAAAKAVLKEAMAIYPQSMELVAYEKELNRVGSVAELTGPLLDGTAFDIASYKGKVVVIDFWASWCGPCKRMTPDLLKLYSDLNAKGVEIIGVNMDRTAADAEKYITTHSIPWKNIFNTTAKDRSELSTKFGITGIPTLFVVGKDGNFATMGLQDFEAVKEAVEKELLK